MATPSTGTDSIGAYASSSVLVQASAYTNPDHLGGYRLPFALDSFLCAIENPIQQVIVEYVSGNHTEGTGYLRSVASYDDLPATYPSFTLYYQAPGDTEGTGVYIDGVLNYDAFTKYGRDPVYVLMSGDGLRWLRVRVCNDPKILQLASTSGTDYPEGSLEGYATLTIRRVYSNGLAMPDYSGAGGPGADVNNYSAIMLYNQSEARVQNVIAYVGNFGDVVSDAAQLGATGAGTVETSETIPSDVPATGWARIVTSGGTLREIVYYEERDDNVLTVPATGRARLGTSAAAGAADDVVYFVPGIRIWSEAPDADGMIQTIVDNTTAPAGASWSTAITQATGMSLGAMDPATNYGLWIHREIPEGAVVDANHISKIHIYFEMDGDAATNYTHTYYGHWRIRDTNNDYYLLFMGEGAMPSFTAGGVVAQSLTLPFNYVLPLPASQTQFWAVVRRLSDLDIGGLNTYPRKYLINADGTLESPAISAPTDIVVSRLPAGGLRLTAQYNRALDADPADTWQVYTKVGSAPTIGVDTPSETAMTGNGLGPVRRLETETQLAAQDTLYVIVRAKRSSDSATSTNTDVYSNTPNYAYAYVPHMMDMFHGTTAANVRYWHKQTGTGSVNLYGVNPGTVRWITDTNGAALMTTLGGTPEYVFRIVKRPHQSIVYSGGNSPLDLWEFHLNSAWYFENVAADFGASAYAGPIEALSETEIYLVSNGLRQIKVDGTNRKIQVKLISNAGAMQDMAAPIDWYYKSATVTYINIWNADMGRYDIVMYISDAGTLALHMGSSIIERIS